jgi:hypothetical protein
MVAAAREFRPDWAVRIGIDHGPVSAGIMGQDTIPPTSGATWSTPPHGSRRPAGRAPSTSAAAPGSILRNQAQGPLARPRRPQRQGKARNRRVRGIEAMTLRVSAGSVCRHECGG